MQIARRRRLGIESGVGLASTGLSGQLSRPAGAVGIKTLSQAEIDLASSTFNTTRNLTNLSRGIQSLEGPTGKLTSVVAKLGPTFGRATSVLSGPVGWTVGTALTIASFRNYESDLSSSSSVKLERLMRDVPKAFDAMSEQINKFATETVPKEFTRIGGNIIKWGSDTAFVLTEILRRPFGETDSTALFNSQEAVDRMLGQDMGRLNSKGEKMTLGDVVEENRTRYGESQAERERKRVEEGDEQYKKIADSVAAFQEDMKKALGVSDEQYKIDQMSGRDQAKVFEKQLAGVERQIKLFSEGNKDFILGLGKSAEELEKWSGDIVKERDKIRSKVDDAWKFMESEKKADFDKWQADDKKRFDRLSKDDQYTELSKQLKDELEFQSRMTTATGKNSVQPQIDDLRYQMKPYEEEMRERADKVRESLFDFEFGNASRSEQRRMLDNATKDYMSQVGALFNKPKLSSGDIDKATELLSKVGGNQEKLASMKDEGLKLPLVENRSMQAVDSRDVQAIELQSRTWNTGSGQKKVEKDTHDIAGHMKKLVALTEKMSRFSQTNNHTTLDD